MYGIGLDPNGFIAYQQNALNNIERAQDRPYQLKETIRSDYLADQQVPAQVAASQNAFYDQQATGQSLRDDAAIYPQLRQYSDQTALNNAQFNSTRSGYALQDLQDYRPYNQQLTQQRFDNAIDTTFAPNAQGLVIGNAPTRFEPTITNDDIGLITADDGFEIGQDDVFTGGAGDDLLRGSLGRDALSNNSILSRVRNEAVDNLTQQTGTDIYGLQDALILAQTDPQYNSIPGLEESVAGELRKAASIGLNYPEQAELSNQILLGLDGDLQLDTLNDGEVFGAFLA